jgi:hypothetical protein
VTKRRLQFVGNVGGWTTLWLNGSIFSRSPMTKSNFATYEVLEQSKGHRGYALLGQPMKKRPKAPHLRLPKPYFGKNADKKAAYEALVRIKKLRYTYKLAQYVKNLTTWTNKFIRINTPNSADSGGPFKARSRIPRPALHHIYDTNHPGAPTRNEVDGTFNASLSGSPLTFTIDSSSDSQMDVYGTRCIAKCAPTNPLSNMGQFLGELKDLPRFFNPFEWKDKAHSFKKLAEKGSDEYLNVEFGWLPFLSDINSFFKVTDNFTRNIQQYDRDSGRHIRRSTELLSTTSTTSTTLGTNFGPFPSPLTLVTPGTLTKDVVLSQRVWFSGSFTYYLPPIDGSVHSYYERYLAYAQHLYGLRIGPDLLWKLTPWSWAIDWFSNTGSVVRNWDAFATQGLVMHYGYVMEHKTQTSTYNLKGFKLSSNPLSQLTDIETEQSKRRRPATPYGFGLNPATFSPFQVGIITALGINRGSRWL